MKTHARVVAIGGGVAGCSTLYHLARLGWIDAVLVERDELTSGSTWHAAAQVTQFGSNQTMVAMKRHSINLYRELAADTDHPINCHITGGMRLAHTQEQLDTYRHHIGMARGVDVDVELIDADEVAQRHPLIEPDGLLGAWGDPLDGDIDPSQLTQALARGARHAGAEVQRFDPVETIERSGGAGAKGAGEWIVHTKNGDIRCEIIVNASGYRVNEVGRMLGVEHPVTSMEHMYFLTDPIPTLEAMNEWVPVIRDPGSDFYSRQEKHGLLVGIYEQACRTFGMDGVDADFTMALCPNDLDRCMPYIETVFKRMPVLEDVGIHTVINGPITYTIDGAMLVLAGPGSRALLQSLCPRSDLSATSLPWLRCLPVRIGYADVLLPSVSYSGELAFELHVRMEQLYLLWQTLTEAGEAHGLGRFGLYAAESMRLESGYRAWKSDLLTEFDPYESSLSRFVDLDKSSFVGREASLDRRSEAPRAHFFVSLLVESTEGTGMPPIGTPLAHAGDPIMGTAGVQIGSVTSGGYGHRVAEHLALGFVHPDYSAIGTRLEVQPLGESHEARVVDPVRDDPKGNKVRA